jgi:hypothetical protein
MGRAGRARAGSLRMPLFAGRPSVGPLAGQVVVDGVGVGAGHRVAGDALRGLAGVLRVAAQPGHVHAGAQGEQQADGTQMRRSVFMAVLRPHLREAICASRASSTARPTKPSVRTAVRPDQGGRALHAELVGQRQVAVDRVVAGGAGLERGCRRRGASGAARPFAIRRAPDGDRPGLALERHQEGVDGDVVEAGQFRLQLFAVRAVGSLKTATRAGRCRARS